jgi:hypothetical protein
MRWLIWISLLLGFCGGCGVRDHEIKGRDFDQAALKIIEVKIGIQFPPGTKGIRMLKREAIDPAFIAMLEIPKSSQESISQELGKKPAKEITVMNGLTHNLAWWNPDEKKTIAQRIYMNGDDLVAVRLCSDSDRLIMYVESSLAN